MRGSDLTAGLSTMLGIYACVLVGIGVVIGAAISYIW